ncbi:hypothetical protein TNCV_1366741 [Trichonephila clavipes]|nr:hypothetical protein TNCV_1366741 [Trichonephila clavipes]
MASHTSTPAVGVVCRRKAKAGLRRVHHGSLHTNTIGITAEIETGFISKDDPVTFRCSQASRAWNHFKRRRRWVSVKGSIRKGCCDPKCPSVRLLSLVRGDTGILNEGDTCTWMAGR